MTLAWLLSAGLAACSGIDPRPEPPTTTEPAPAMVQGLDGVIAEHWAAAGVEPSEEADDAELQRRVTLDLIGRIPTPEEVERFAALDDLDPRRALVDELLASDEWAEHWAELLTETLLDGAAQDRPRVREGLQAWLREQLMAGAGWDELTTAMLTTDGEVELRGPAGFLLAHGRNGQVEALTGQTARVFMGLQLQCAQCHDDPDDRFTQAQFYGLAAYYTRTRARILRDDGAPTIRIVDKARGEMRMPTELDAPGDRSGPRVSPSFPTLALAGDEAGSRREQLARGIAGSRAFAKATVNHAWARLMGRGIVEPWDDLGGLAGDEHPALLEWLADDFVAHDYDLRHLLRTIVLSSAYQRSSRGAAEGSLERERAFAQAAVRPMSASQLMRSLLVATGLDDVTGRAFKRQVELRRQQVRRDFELAFDDDEPVTDAGSGGNLPQALLLLNGELTNQALLAPDGALAAILREHPRPEARIDALFLRVFGHAPSSERRAELVAFVSARGDRASAYEDLAHAMLMTSEFSTIH
ncbi:MAG: DUF1549 domain-containing protein [Myxococcales bacterium]|nr:DUF1549 domain-containing protein [Myxococcales bacterium]